MPVVDLSIDWDFWSPEDLAWDWGHGEGGQTGALFIADIWSIRYLGTRSAGEYVDLHEATSHSLADFEPQELLPELHRRGLRFAKRGALGYANSHVAALGFLTRGRAPDLLLHIDAHHDCYGRENMGELSSPHCGNWLQHYMVRTLGKVPVVWLAPHWQSGGHMQAGWTAPTYAQHRWADWPGLDQPHRVRNVFVCQSAEWVPPHHDEAFGNFVRLLACGAKGVRELGQCYDRSTLIPTPEEIAADRTKWEAMLQPQPQEAGT
jgi:hypothetical protein